MGKLAGTWVGDVKPRHRPLLSGAEVVWDENAGIILLDERHSVRHHFVPTRFAPCRLAVFLAVRHTPIACSLGIGVVGGDDTVGGGGGGGDCLKGL